MAEANKDKTGKPDLSLIPYAALVPMAEAMMDGESKYQRYNYLKGHKVTDLIAAAMRHLAKFNDGEDRAPDSGVHHLGHAMANCLMILRQIEHGTSIDNRFGKQASDSAPEAPASVPVLAPSPKKKVTVYQVVAQGTLSPAVRVVLGTYPWRDVAELMLREYFRPEWPASSYDLVIKEIETDE